MRKKLSSRVFCPRVRLSHEGSATIRVITPVPWSGPEIYKPVLEATTSSISMAAKREASSKGLSVMALAPPNWAPGKSTASRASEIRVYLVVMAAPLPATASKAAANIKSALRSAERLSVTSCKSRPSELIPQAESIMLVTWASASMFWKDMFPPKAWKTGAPSVAYSLQLFWAAAWWWIMV